MDNIISSTAALLACRRADRTDWDDYFSSSAAGVQTRRVRPWLVSMMQGDISDLLQNERHDEHWHDQRFLASIFVTKYETAEYAREASERWFERILHMSQLQLAPHMRPMAFARWVRESAQHGVIGALVLQISAVALHIIACSSLITSIQYLSQGASFTGPGIGVAIGFLVCEWLRALVTCQVWVTAHRQGEWLISEVREMPAG